MVAAPRNFCSVGRDQGVLDAFAARLVSSLVLSARVPQILPVRALQVTRVRRGSMYPWAWSKPHAACRNSLRRQATHVNSNIQCQGDGDHQVDVGV